MPGGRGGLGVGLVPHLVGVLVGEDCGGRVGAARVHLANWSGRGLAADGCHAHCCGNVLPRLVVTPHGLRLARGVLDGTVCGVTSVLTGAQCIHGGLLMLLLLLLLLLMLLLLLLLSTVITLLVRRHMPVLLGMLQSKVGVAIGV